MEEKKSDRELVRNPTQLLLLMEGQMNLIRNEVKSLRSEVTSLKDKLNNRHFIRPLRWNLYNVLRTGDALETLANLSDEIHGSYELRDLHTV